MTHRDCDQLVVEDPADWSVGTRLEAYDVRKIWCRAVVLAERGEGDSRELLIHYIGWKKRWDEWLCVHGGNLRPLSVDLTLSTSRELCPEESIPLAVASRSKRKRHDDNRLAHFRSSKRRAGFSCRLCLSSHESPRWPTLKRHSILITACSYATLAALVQPLLDVPEEARAIQAAFSAHSTVLLNDPSIDALAAALPGKTTWFFLGHGDAMVHGERMLLFVGDNGRCMNGLQALSHDALASMIASSSRNLSTIVLNGCKTLSLAKAILAHCSNVLHVVCWQSASHSGAAAVFGAELARGMAKEDGARTSGVQRAFEGAKAAVLRQLEPGKLVGGAPIGLPMYAFEDPEDKARVHSCCPCVPQCPADSCWMMGRLIMRGSTQGVQRQLFPRAAGLPCLLTRGCG